MSQDLFDVDSLKIAKPCNANWLQMDGDTRARHCALCKKNVYNVAGMTRSDVTNLINNNEGKVCMRLSRRADGTVITKDCPVGLAGIRKRMSVAAMMGFLILFSGLAMAKNVRYGEKRERVDMINELRSKPVIGSVVDLFWPSTSTVLMGATITMGDMPMPVSSSTPPPVSGSPAAP